MVDVNKGKIAVKTRKLGEGDKEGRKRWTEREYKGEIKMREKNVQ